METNYKIKITGDIEIPITSSEFESIKQLAYNLQLRLGCDIHVSNFQVLGGNVNSSLKSNQTKNQ